MPDASTWKYVENQFEVRTRENRAMMDKLVQDHYAKLVTAKAQPGSDPQISDLLSSFTTVKDQWDKEYAEWKNTQATYGGSTVSLETLLSNLATTPGPEQVSKIEDWDSRIRAVAPKGTSVYVTLLPRGRAPFGGGKRDDIIDEVKNLGTRLAAQTTNATLVALGTEVTTYYNQLRNARDAQQGLEGQSETESGQVAPARQRPIWQPRDAHAHLSGQPDHDRGLFRSRYAPSQREKSHACDAAPWAVKREATTPGFTERDLLPRAGAA